MFVGRGASTLAGVVSVALLAAPQVATAQERDPAPSSSDAAAQARQHFERGVKLYQEDDFRTALIEFNRAYEIAPNWQVLYNIGQSYYQLRDYANALATMEKYVAEGGGRIARDRRQQVDGEMEELRGRVAHVTFSSNVDGAEISIDDVSIGRTPFAAPKVVSAGRHTVRASKPGWLATTKVVDIAGGDASSIRIDLADVPHVTSAPAQTSPNYVPAYIVGGAGIAGLVVGSVFGILAIHQKSTLNGECNTAKACPPGTQSDIDGFNRDGAVSTVAFGLGALGVVAGIYLFATANNIPTGDAPAASPPDRAARPSPSFTVRPWWLGSAGAVGTF